MYVSCVRGSFICCGGSWPRAMIPVPASEPWRPGMTSTRACCTTGDVGCVRVGLPRRRRRALCRRAWQRLYLPLSRGRRSRPLIAYVPRRPSRPGAATRSPGQANPTNMPFRARRTRSVIARNSAAETPSLAITSRVNGSLTRSNRANLGRGSSCMGRTTAVERPYTAARHMAWACPECDDLEVAGFVKSVSRLR